MFPHAGSFYRQIYVCTYTKVEYNLSSASFIHALALGIYVPVVCFFCIPSLVEVVWCFKACEHNTFL